MKPVEEKAVEKIPKRPIARKKIEKRVSKKTNRGELKKPDQDIPEKVISLLPSKRKSSESDGRKTKKIKTDEELKVPAIEAPRRLPALEAPRPPPEEGKKKETPKKETPKKESKKEGKKKESKKPPGVSKKTSDGNWVKKRLNKNDSLEERNEKTKWNVGVNELKRAEKNLEILNKGLEKAETKKKRDSLQARMDKVELTIERRKAWLKANEK